MHAVVERGFVKVNLLVRQVQHRRAHHRAHSLNPLLRRELPQTHERRLGVKRLRATVLRRLVRRPARLGLQPGLRALDAREAHAAHRRERLPARPLRPFRAVTRDVHAFALVPQVRHQVIGVLLDDLAVHDARPDGAGGQIAGRLGEVELLHGHRDERRRAHRRARHLQSGVQHGRQVRPVHLRLEHVPGPLHARHRTVRPRVLQPQRAAPAVVLRGGGLLRDRRLRGRRERERASRLRSFRGDFVDGGVRRVRALALD